MKKRIVAITSIILLLALAMLVVACGDEGSVSEQNASSQQEEPRAEPELTQYVSDDTVNRFINEYNDLYDPDITDISERSIGYGCDLNGYLIELSSTDGLEIVVNATADKPEMGGTQEVLEQIVPIVDPSLSLEEFDGTYESILSEDYLKENVELGKIKLTYAPTKDLSGGRSLGHVTVKVDSY